MLLALLKHMGFVGQATTPAADDETGWLARFFFQHWIGVGLWADQLGSSDRTFVDSTSSRVVDIPLAMGLSGQGSIAMRWRNKAPRALVIVREAGLLPWVLKIREPTTGIVLKFVALFYQNNSFH